MAPCPVQSSWERSAARHGQPQARAQLLYRFAFVLVLGFIIWKWLNSVHSLNSNQECSIGFGYTSGSIPHFLACSRKLGNRSSSKGFLALNPLEEPTCFFSFLWLWILKWTQVPSPNAVSAATDKYINCEECIKCFYAVWANLGESELLELKSANGSRYCTGCKADCGLCSGAVFMGHKAVQCDKCEMWIHNKCSIITDSQFESVENTNCSPLKDPKPPQTAPNHHKTPQTTQKLYSTTHNHTKTSSFHIPLTTLKLMK